MLQSEPEDVFLNYALAMAMMAEGSDDDALSQLEHVIDLDPDYVASYFQLGQAYARAGKVELSRDALERGIRAARRTGDSHALSEMTGFLELL